MGVTKELEHHPTLRLAAEEVSTFVLLGHGRHC